MLSTWEAVILFQMKTVHQGGNNHNTRPSAGGARWPPVLAVSGIKRDETRSKINGSSGRAEAEKDT